MIRYLENPDDRTRSVIDASPTDIDQFRPVIRKFLRRKFSMLGREGIEDLVQHVMCVACRAVSRGAVVGRSERPPESELRTWLFDTAWRTAMNAKRARQSFVSIIEVEGNPDGIDYRSLPDAIVDARLMLELVAKQPRSFGIRALLMIAQGGTFRSVAREMGVTRTTVLTHVQNARRRLCALRDRGPWNEPKQPKQPSPRSRKRKR